ncbi:WXG100 family type VII secretion target [Nocardioides sp. SYSU DS0651]|uniref:WXG100 family type VII secretion target n=1 Tax=Nocardioides sp. SYSU DS0651 TaxID=3415955 RepID=UPI003F4C1B0C
MGIDLVHEALDKAKADVRAAASELRTTRTSINDRVNGFLGDGWTGVAAASFVPAWNDWLDGALDMEEGLVATAELLDAFHRDMRAQDGESQRQLDAISARIIDRLSGDD